MHKLQLSIIIPCLNERVTIGRVINDVRVNADKLFKGKYEIIVSDNGSTDGTLDLLKKMSDVRIINTPIKGYGAALHWGIMNAKGAYVLYADADGSYPFSNLKKFKNMIDKNADLILGSRMLGNISDGAMPFLHRYLGTPILTFLIRLLYKIPTSDCNSGMRMIKKSFYQSLNMRNSGMEWASEVLLKTALNDGKYLEVPITFKKDMRDRKPHLSTWSDGWRHLKSILLLKSETLYFTLVVFVLSALLSVNISFALVFLFINLSIVLFLSILTLELLGSIINKKDSSVSLFLQNFKLVPITILILLIVGIIIIMLPERHLGTKLLFTSLLGIIFMWIFLIETIKTHLINRLPDINE